MYGVCVRACVCACVRSCVRTRHAPSSFFDQDRPLVVQFAGDDAATLIAAAALVREHVDAVDINLGCPERVAKKGRYGAFLVS